MSTDIKLIREEFAKVFTADNYQLLVYWEQDEDNEGAFILNQITRTTSGEANFKICLNTETAVKKVFEKYDQSAAEKMIKIHQQELQGFNNIFNTQTTKS